MILRRRSSRWYFFTARGHGSTRKLSKFLQSAGLTLRKWASNNPTFLETILEELKENQQTISLDSEENITTLGLQWNSQTIQLQFKSGFTYDQAVSVTANKTQRVSHNSIHFPPSGTIQPICNCIQDVS
jgi:hypothetical protein